MLTWGTQRTGGLTPFPRKRTHGNETMEDIAVTHNHTYGSLLRPTYHHRNVPAALRNAALQVLEAGNPEDVGLRELSRRVGVSATAAYRHFSGKDDLMATVAIEGFKELTAALRLAASEAGPAVAVGLAYLEFALARRGLFRLMFGPLLAQRRVYPALHTAAVEAFRVIECAGRSSDQLETRDDTESLATWSLIHGLASLFIENVVPPDDAKRLAEQILANVGRNAEMEPAAA